MTQCRAHYGPTDVRRHSLDSWCVYVVCFCSAFGAFTLWSKFIFIFSAPEGKSKISAWCWGFHQIFWDTFQPRKSKSKRCPYERRRHCWSSKPNCTMNCISEKIKLIKKKWQHSKLKWANDSSTTNVQLEHNSSNKKHHVSKVLWWVKTFSDTRWRSTSSGALQAWQQNYCGRKKWSRAQVWMLLNPGQRLFFSNAYT